MRLDDILSMRSLDAGSYLHCSVCEQVARTLDGECVAGEHVGPVCEYVFEIMDHKRLDLGQSRLVQSIEQHGFVIPVLIASADFVGRKLLVNGHHRIAACEDLGIDAVPVTYDQVGGWEESWPMKVCSRQPLTSTLTVR